MSRLMHIDIETYSAKPLPKCSMYRYAASTTFEILLLSYAFDDAPVQIIALACGEKPPQEFMDALEDPNVLKIAHNAAFERVCLSCYVGHWLDPHQWRCSMVLAAYNTLPLALANVAVALNVTEKKMEEGKDLMSKAQRDTVKDIGGLVGGYLKNGKRNNASVVNRCLVCLDIDNADPEVLSDIDLSFLNAYAPYSTHSHTPEKMRLRLIIPLSRTVAPDEYAAISRRIADDLVLSRFDPTTFEPTRLMYWPSTPKDGQYVFLYENAPFLDPDKVLASYADWRDASLWPTTRSVEEQTRAKIGKQEDPLAKRGIIGAFNRAHSMTNVLETILKDVYSPTPFHERYTFNGGSTTGGLVIYDDVFAYSHHATDPAGGKLCNAFDLVRWHLFSPGTPTSDGSIVKDDADSRRRMQDYASRDEATKRQLAQERKEQMMADFGNLDDEESKANKPSQPDADTHWEDRLDVDRQGKVRDTLGNLALILRNDPRLKDISYNIHRSGIDIRKGADGKTTLPWTQIKRGWGESDFGALQIYLDGLYGMKDKIAPEKLQGQWILELGELAGLKKRDVETVKAFVSRQDDKFRHSYGYNVEDHPRQCIIVGSTNTNDGFLRDITGNRRFWPVSCSKESPHRPWEVEGVVEQLWAEAYLLYLNGEKLYLSAEQEELANQEQTAALESDVREGMIAEYLDKLLPESWDKMDLAARRGFLRGDQFTGGDEPGTVRRTVVSAVEVWAECFGRDPATIRRSDTYDIFGMILKIGGWEKYKGNKLGQQRRNPYGPQRCFVRVNEPAQKT